MSGRAAGLRTALRCAPALPPLRRRCPSNPARPSRPRRRAPSRAHRAPGARHPRLPHRTHGRCASPAAARALPAAGAWRFVLTISSFLFFFLVGLCGPQVMHRDLKPQNVFLTRENCVRLGDFGISKVRTRPGRRHPLPLPALSPPAPLTCSPRAALCAGARLDDEHGAHLRGHAALPGARALQVRGRREAAAEGRAPRAPVCAPR